VNYAIGGGQITPPPRAVRRTRKKSRLRQIEPRHALWMRVAAVWISFIGIRGSCGDDTSAYTLTSEESYLPPRSCHLTTSVRNGPLPTSGGGGLAFSLGNGRDTFGQTGQLTTSQPPRQNFPTGNLQGKTEDNFGRTGTPDSFPPPDNFLGVGTSRGRGGVAA